MSYIWAPSKQSFGCSCSCTCMTLVHSSFIPFLAHAYVAAGGYQCTQADQRKQNHRHKLQSSHETGRGGVCRSGQLPKLGKLEDAGHGLAAVEFLLLQLQCVQLEASQGAERSNSRPLIRMAVLGQSILDAARGREGSRCGEWEKTYSCSCSISIMEFVCGSTA